MKNKIKVFFSSSAGKVLGVLLLIFIGVAIGSIKQDTPLIVQNIPQQNEQQTPTTTTETSQPVAIVKTAPVQQQKIKPDVITPTTVNTYTPTPTPKTTPTPVVTSKDWHIVGTFTGSSNTNTDSFKMKGGKYRFNTSCYPLDTSITVSAVFGTIRSTAGFSSGYENFENSLECPIAAHISYVYAQDPGDWYLAIQAVNAKWVVTVEDYY